MGSMVRHAGRLHVRMTLVDKCRDLLGAVLLPACGVMLFVSHSRVCVNLSKWTSRVHPHRRSRLGGFTACMHARHQGDIAMHLAWWCIIFCT